MGACKRWFGVRPNTKAAVRIFGFFHGFGLATKIIEYNISKDGLLPNLLAFNVGVEIGQLLALGMILIAMSYWLKAPGFWRDAYSAHVVIISTVCIIIGY